jgi:hypothetical protein
MSNRVSVANGADAAALSSAITRVPPTGASFRVQRDGGLWFLGDFQNGDPIAGRRFGRANQVALPVRIRALPLFQFARARIESAD